MSGLHARFSSENKKAGSADTGAYSSRIDQAEMTDSSAALADQKCKAIYRCPLARRAVAVLIPET
jgi:hypothetical protein